MNVIKKFDSMRAATDGINRFVETYNREKYALDNIHIRASSDDELAFEVEMVMRYKHRFDDGWEAESGCDY